MRKETRCRYIGYSYRLAARVLLYAPSHRQDNTYHGLCYTSRGALVGTRIYLTMHATFLIWLYGIGHSERENLLPPLHGLFFLISSKDSLICTISWPLLHQSWSTGWNEKYLSGSTLMDRSNDPSHHELQILPRSYISLPCDYKEIENI